MKRCEWEMRAMKAMKVMKVINGMKSSFQLNVSSF